MERTILRVRSARRTQLVAATAGLCLLGSHAGRSDASSRTWTGATDNQLVDPNWDVIPVSGDSWTFPPTPPATYTSLNLNNNLTTGTGFTVTGISFLASSPALVIGDGTPAPNSGNAFTASGTFSNASVNVQTINNPFAVASTGLTIGTNGTTGGAIVLTGNISGTGGLTIFQSTTLSGNNSFSGNILLPGPSATGNATLNFSSAANLGSGAFISLGNNAHTGTLKYTGSGETISRNINLSSGNASANSSGIFDNSGGGTLTLSGTVLNSGKSHVLVLQGSAPAVLSGGLIDDSTNLLSINETGTSTWFLTGATNTYRGTTTVASGTLAGIGANAFGSTSGISIAAAGILSLKGDTNTSFVKASDNVTPYSVSTSATGATINVDQATGAGTAAKTMTIGAIGSTSTAAGVTFNFSGANNTSLTTGAVTGPASTAVATVALANSNTTGTTTFASYTSANTTGGETLTVSGAGNTNVIGAITPSATSLRLSKTGTGILTLSGSSTYVGGTTVQDSGGVLAITSANALGTGAATIGTGSGGLIERLQISNNITLASVPTINLAGANVGSLNLLTGARIENLSGANTIASNLNASALGGQYSIFVSAGSLTFTGNLSTALSGQTARNYAFAGPGDTFVTGSITNNGTSTSIGLIKDGTGSLTLSGNTNSYTVTTSVNGGKLIFTNTSGSATGGSAVVANSATTPATVAGTGFSTGQLTVSGGSHVAPGINTVTPAGDGTNLGNFGSAGTLSVGTTNGLTLTAANLDFDLAATNTPGTSDLIKTGATLNLTSAVMNFNGLGSSVQTGVNYVLITGQTNDVTANLGNITTTNFLGSLAGNYAATYSSVLDDAVYDLDVTFTASTPEPSTLCIVGGAAFALMGRRRRQSKFG